MSEFLKFLKQYGVIGLAIAVIIGGKANTFVTSIVDGLIMPVVGALTPGGNWREAEVVLGGIHLKPGLVLGAGIDFLIVAWLVFVFSKKVLKEEEVSKK
ncbi:MAG: MscL family protein [Gemmatimonadales bacterium]|nr:MscL family protein [Gemmatimonadales bacterium]